MKSIFSIIILTSAIFFTSCKKDPGPGGNTTIATIVKHHGTVIPGATIYVKYGAKEFPGGSPTNYDASSIADNAGHTHFEDLNLGDYFFYAVGYDSTISEPVTGGIHYEITKKDKNKHVDVNIAVVE
jgi:hypothetical protein